jgi:TolA-binding protein
LLGDSLIAKGETDEAIATYIRSYKAATTDEVLGYSLFEAQKAQQKKGDWTAMSGMFQEFVKEHPEHAIVPMAMFWIGKAKARDGKVDEAKQFIADTIKKYIDDPRRDAVEQLLTQLAQLCARKKRPAPVAVEAPSATPAAVANASPSATPVATPTPEPQVDPGVELDQLLGNAGEQSQTAKARIIYAKAEVARLRKKTDEQNKLLAGIAHDFKPEDLSPMLLAQSGDVLFARGETEKAAALFQHLMDNYPKSDVVDFAYSGLGEIAFQKKDYQKALALFTEAIEVVGANQKLKDVTIGRAKCLLALGRLDEAQKVFEQVASVREWRGDATAFAVYSLGEIQFKRGKWAEANASFQRVYVAYQKFLPWVAKAYIMSGECFEKLGKKPEAARTYQEMLRNEKLAKFEETGAARKRLQEIGGGS